MEDPYDNDWIKSVVSNPFGESRSAAPHRTHISSDVMSMLKGWSRRHGISSDSQGSVLTENVNETIVEIDEEEANRFNTGDENDVLIIDDDGDDEL